MVPDWDTVQARLARESPRYAPTMVRVGLASSRRTGTFRTWEMTAISARGATRRSTVTPATVTASANTETIKR